MGRHMSPAPKRSAASSRRDCRMTDEPKASYRATALVILGAMAIGAWFWFWLGVFSLALG